jgi:hypothetical protein
MMRVYFAFLPTLATAIGANRGSVLNGLRHCFVRVAVTHSRLSGPASDLTSHKHSCAGRLRGRDTLRCHAAGISNAGGLPS